MALNASLSPKRGRERGNGSGKNFHFVPTFGRTRPEIFGRRCAANLPGRCSSAATSILFRTAAGSTDVSIRWQPSKFFAGSTRNITDAHLSPCALLVGRTQKGG